VIFWRNEPKETFDVKGYGVCILVNSVRKIGEKDSRRAFSDEIKRIFRPRNSGPWPGVDERQP
jgi:hypothetical protein